MESMVVFYQCHDLSRTDQFYIEKLGMKLWNDQPGCHIYDSGYGYLGFVETPEFKLPSYSCISFNCTDCSEVDRIFENFREDPSVTCPRKHPHFDVYSFFIKDPDGYTVEFQKILKEETL